MHFHLPKPLHGWRAFAGEVGIIVLGVLIALGAGQVVETVHERTELRDLRSALRAELADDRARWESIRASDRCTGQRLSALEEWLASAPPGARLIDAYHPFLWNMHVSAWDSAKTSPAGQLLGLDERLTYASLYEGLENWRFIDGKEVDNAEEISSLFATADQRENRRKLPELLVRARGYLNGRQQNYPYFFTRFDALEVRPDASKLTINIDSNALCEPLENAG